MSNTSSPKFTHLHVHSHYSLLDGLTKIDDLLNCVKEQEMGSVAITDHGNLYGAIEFYQKAKRRGIKPIIGLEGYISAGDMHDKRPNIDDKRWHITLLAENNQGYKNLIQLITKAHLEGFYYKPRFDKNLLREYAKGIIALSGCLGAEIPTLIQENKIEEAKKAIDEYKAIFGKNNFFLEVQSHPNLEDQKKVNEVLYQLARETNTPLVATQDSHYLRPEDAEAHDVLLAIQTGNTIDDTDRLTLKDDDFSLKSPQQMAEEFQEHPEALENAYAISERCNVEIQLGKYQLPRFLVPKAYTADTYLKKLCEDGLPARYGKTIDKEMKDRLAYELSVIEKTGFAPYFLIVQDFVNWAKKQNIAVGPGRGSVAGSLVSYLLKITNIDPIKFNLLFERFLNPDRISMPDIDLDFADHRRDEVLHYVAEKYGNDNVAQIITFGTMAARAAVRDAGRALGYTYDYCDVIAKHIPTFYSLDKALKEVTELKNIYHADPKAQKLLDTARRLEGVARHASVHACGVVITKDPLIEIVPLQRSTQDDQSIITQYEMHAIEDLGLLKMDFLGLKNLTIIEKTVAEIKQRHSIDVDMESIPINDQKTFKLLQAGDTTGVFQLESSGMRRYLKELKPTELEDITAMVALYRPGPLEAGMVPHYIQRKHGKEPVSYLHPKLEPILKTTYGIGVYQEQMMQIARDLAGFTLAEADTLRKAIGKKIKKLLDEQHEKLVNGMVGNNIKQKTAEAIWELFPSFARYGFNRSHAACYARIAYETAYLKAYYPIEFLTAWLNAEQKNIDRLSFLIQETKQSGIRVLPPSLNESNEEFTVIDKTTVRFGLTAIKNVGSNIARYLIEERQKNGPYTSLENVLERTDTRDFNKKSFEALIKAGAFDEWSERNTLLENLDALLQYARERRNAHNAGQYSLFGPTMLNISSQAKIVLNPPVAAGVGISLRTAIPATAMQKLTWEKELLGFFITGHPLESHAAQLKQLTPIKSLARFAESPSKLIPIGGIVQSAKKILTKNGQPMMFVGLEDLSGTVEAVVFPVLFEKKQHLLTESALVSVVGRINTRDGEIKLICEDITELV